MRARLYIRVRLKDGHHPFLEPAYSADAKIKPFYAVVNGEPEHHPESVYYVRYVRRGKRVWEPVGTDTASAAIALRKRNAILTAEEANVEVVANDHQETSSGRSIAAAINEYLDEVKAAKSRKTHLAYPSRPSRHVSHPHSLLAHQAANPPIPIADVVHFLAPSH